MENLFRVNVLRGLVLRVGGLAFKLRFKRHGGEITGLKVNMALYDAREKKGRSLER